MHTRRVASWLLGAWMSGSLLMFLVATQNFRAVDRLLTAPAEPASKLIQSLGPDGARLLLRYHSSELNRWYFTKWEIAQAALLSFLAGWCYRAISHSRVARFLPVAILVLVLLERFLLTPEIVRLGRLIDFAPAAPERAQFWRLHGAYSAVEALKLLLGVVLTAALLRKTKRSSGQVHLVDEADHRHVNR
ncbi:MAG: hypothetical protein HYR60_00135 [Acidobacteria bacterium]|nr:hypothetical protein [Acidobacteriota bacterium]